MKIVKVKMSKPLRCSYRRDEKRLKEFKLKENDSAFNVTLTIGHLSLLRTYNIANKAIDKIIIIDGKHVTTIQMEDDAIIARNKFGELATDKIIRVGHNLFRMYLGGEFTL